MSAAAGAGAVAIGGVFFRARDPEALGRWYADHLGVPSHGPWPQASGVAVFAPFPDDSNYWPAGRAFMLDLRVTGLDALIGRLRSAGVAVETRAEWDDAGIGRFARIADPEGNPVELWEAPAP